MYTQGYIKLHRSLFQWEWFGDINTRVLYIYLLLAANYSDQRWRGQMIRRGQLVTSVDRLAEDNRMSRSQVRTALGNLEKTGEITREATSRYTLITIMKYGKYQSAGEHRRRANRKQPASKEQADEKPIAANKEDKNTRKGSDNPSKGIRDKWDAKFGKRAGEIFRDNYRGDPADIAKLVVQYGGRAVYEAVCRSLDYRPDLPLSYVITICENYAELQQLKEDRHGGSGRPPE